MTDGAPAAVAAPATDWDMTPKPEEQPARAKRTRRSDHPPAAVHTSAPIVADPPAPDAPADLRRIPLALLHESPWNPRKRYHGLDELADSLKKGQLTPCLVRPREGGTWYELAAGHRRLRAAPKAGFDALDCIVREMDDRRFLEVLVIENDQREDVHPLEEAQGYRQLMESAGYDVPAIAARVGRSVKYVYDRLKLLQLTPEAKTLFLDGRFEAGHAILLARLTPAQQKAALDSQHGGLFEVEVAGDTDEDGQPVDRGGQRRFGALVEGGRGQKPASVREFATWINDHVRLTEAAIADPVLFPEQAAQLEEATERKLKVIHISVDHQLHPDARLEGQRTYGPMSWAYADGQEHRPRYGGRAKVAKTCAHAVLGLVVAGEGRGGMFQVCIAKEKCATHWPEHVKKAQARKVAAAAPAKTSAAKGKDAAKATAPKKVAVPFDQTPEGKAAIETVLEKRLPRIAVAVEAIATKELKGIPDVLAWNLFQWFPDFADLLYEGTRQWASVGKEARYGDGGSEFIDARLVRELPGKWRKGGYSIDALDATAARHGLAAMIYLSRDFDGKKFDAEVIAEAEAAVKAEQEKTKAASPAKAAKKGAATKKARKR